MGELKNEGLVGQETYIPRKLKKGEIEDLEKSPELIAELKKLKSITDSARWPINITFLQREVAEKVIEIFRPVLASYDKDSEWFISKVVAINVPFLSKHPDPQNPALFVTLPILMDKTDHSAEPVWISCNVALDRIQSGMIMNVAKWLPFGEMTSDKSDREPVYKLPDNIKKPKYI